ncbi:family 78 glycoside hydrolase catalytic domain [uncultured Polaribacter sp.]|uniref:family 78 glycoside hydrolase catalytic domain n=1 Tax=uncultured Polaribacter sp. TaxID=174711 RepID=UPI00260EBFA1|nr:family 78 glycoside hydrolase catalytic domain [uncultured Polaribacter sp.]
MKSNIIFLILAQLLFLSCVEKNNTNLERPNSLSVSEGFENPLGFHDSIPSFSWKLPAEISIKKQTAYSIVVASNPDLLPENPDVWSSGKIISNQSVFVKYGGNPLKSRQKIYWQVRFWDNENRASNWSEIVSIEMGLLSNKDWKAKWIKIPDPKKWDTTRYGTRLFRPQYLRNDFKIESKVKKARLYATAKGVFKAQINGQQIGNDVLTPGWTPYRKRIESLTYDVTNMLQEDKNTLGIILAEGWHSGRFGPKRRWDTVIAPPQVIFQLEIEDIKGNKKTITSNGNWKATRKGPIRVAGLYDGETYDANFEMLNWDKPDFDDSSWEKVITEEIQDKIKLFPKKHAAIRNKKILHPSKMMVQKKNQVLFDFDQNMVGVVELKIPVKKGDTIKIRHGEMLNAAGKLFTKNLGSAKATDYYIAKESATISWQPKFTFHGFRYVEISGYNNESTPKKSWVKGIVQHSDFEMSGHFKSSHTKLNQLHSNIQWGLRGNFFDVPLDCPQRSERLGWTGDAQVFIPTSLFLADTHAFWSAWLSSMREEQFSNGGIPVVVPNFTGNFAQAGWSDASTIIPWELYYRTGDIKVLEDNYEMMQKWCDYHTSEATNNISHMSTVGDWLQPYSQQKDDRRGDTPNTLISSAFYAYSVYLTMETAKVLGFKEDVKHYQDLLNKISKAFENEFFDSTGKIKAPYTPTQTGYLLALGFNILSEETANKSIHHLVQLIRDRGTHLRTGFIGTPLLALVLDKTGNIDLLYEIIFKETYPSWFYSINQGATTMWERWDGYTHDKGFANRALSFNHYAYGAIGQWLYERTAGISPLEPGYKKILFAPLPHENISEAQGSYNSIYGEIKSEWKFTTGNFVYNITVPTNTTAKVILPRFSDNIYITVNGNKVEAVLTDEKLTIDNLESGVYEIIYNDAH